MTDNYANAIIEKEAEIEKLDLEIHRLQQLRVKAGKDLNALTTAQADWEELMGAAEQQTDN